MTLNEVIERLQRIRDANPRAGDAPFTVEFKELTYPHGVRDETQWALEGRLDEDGLYKNEQGRLTRGPHVFW